MKPKLFIPGPTHVDQEILDAMAQYPIGHRTPDYRDLQSTVVSGIKNLLYTEQHVLISTSSATGLMEAGVRNLSRKKVANFICGAFSKRQAEITRICGLNQDIFEVEWGKATTAEQVDSALSTGDYDLVTVVFNETSTGVMNPLAEIAEAVNKYPGVLLMVDAVSGMLGAPIKVDEWGIDMALASVQKAWALPPGFAVTSLSERALERSRSIPEPQKGFYFDFVRLHKAGEKSQTPITPSIPHLYALAEQINRINVEGLENRFQRHRDMANRVRDWGKDQFGLFAEAGYESDTLTCFGNEAGIDLIALADKMKERNYLISGGYGDLKGQTFRLAHMGDLQMTDIEDVLGVLDEVIQEL
ncbi:MAG: alanine--glyoxylate aminotransferase family protein [Candidatus Marinimicrobia bacterium]|nr:alanine--glyoxylate aminotransferase family protein [Candidatus Neomarinimicrobiota bacterium]MCF7850172.1 alanine--glyoxylate aminotransferase family protein [Candidatus Neomarinimicrobiota bacterium]MCF7905466.1 alanine--glyoxylate aminotransferase family protein [Candidatus Neomarinimicrobiota bacterium]